MATFTKRSTGFQAQVFLSGKRRAKTFSRLSDAKRWAAQMEADHANGVVEGSRLPLAHFIKLHREHILKAHKHPRHESAVLGYLLTDPISEIPAKDVTPKDVENWINRRRTIPSTTTGYIVKESTISRQLQILSAMFSRMVRNGDVLTNPCHGVEKPGEVPHRERVATEAEIEKLKLVSGFVEGEMPRNKMQIVCAAFILACFTGMRAGEMLRIERSWIDGRTIHLPAEATKTSTGRTIALCDRAKTIIDSVLELGFSPRIWGIDDASRDALWRKIRDKADLGAVRDSEGRIIEEGLNFHDGRATFCTWAASPGADGAPRLDVMSLARQTGHRNLKMLMRYYRPNIESFVDRLNK